MDLKQLAEPFPAEDIEWRVSRSGIREGKPWAKVLAYVTARAIFNRLDIVCSIENWQNEYKPAPLGGVLCGISIYIDKRWILKWDGSDNTNIEAVKGGLSSAMKRAGSVWGIGRYLYNLDEGWAEFIHNGKHQAKIKDGNGKESWYKWDSPQLPEWALPKRTKIPSPKPEFNRNDAIKKIDALMIELKCNENYITQLQSQYSMVNSQKDFIEIQDVIRRENDA